MKIQILGTGCPSCKKLEEAAVTAVKEMEIMVEVVKINDLEEIMNMGVMITPAFAVDGDVLAAGKVLTVEEIKKILKDRC